MARRGTVFIPNNTYFFTFTILGWCKIFLTDKYCQPIFKWFEYCQKNYQNKIQGYVVMPDHVHVLMFLSKKSPKPAILIMNAKRFIAYELVSLLNRDNKTELLNYFKKHARTQDRAHHKIFSDGYDSLLVESHKFFLQKLNYIHNNPVRKGLSKEPEEYRYSSASNYVTGSGYYQIDIVDF